MPDTIRHGGGFFDAIVPGRIDDRGVATAIESAVMPDLIRHPASLRRPKKRAPGARPG